MMSHDTYDRNCFCYINESNRLWASAMLFSSAARSFQTMYRVSNFIRFSNSISMIGSPGIFPDFIEFTQESLMDSVKLTICFENFMKGLLLKCQYLIHEIVPAGNQKLKGLAKKQKDEPIPISEFLTSDTMIYDEKKQMNVFPGLSNKTLKISTLLQQSKYKAIISLPNSIHSFVMESVEKRNSLHYLLGEAESYSIQDLYLLKEVGEFIDSRIVSEFNLWCMKNGCKQLLFCGLK